MKYFTLLAAFFLSLPLFAQPSNSPTGRPALQAQRLMGESDQIKARQRWFIESRGLNQTTEPQQLRRQAVALTKRASKASIASSHQWNSIGPSPANMLNWVMGRVAGRVSALAWEQGNENTLYLGTASGGLWKTTNGGNAWVNVFDQVGTQTIGSVFVDQNNHVWAGTGEQWQVCTSYFGLGLFKSEDGGNTWLERNGTGANRLELSYVNAVAASPADANLVLAGGHAFCDNGSYQDGGLFRSTDNGLNWTRVLTGSVNSVVFNPQQPNICYAAVGRYAEEFNGIYKSTDGGATWARMENGIAFGSNMTRCKVVIAPSNPSTVYVLANQGSTYLYRSDNDGSSWTVQNNSACEGQCWYNMAIDVHPTNPNTLLLGSIRFARSTDGGKNLTYLTSSWGSSQKVHQDTHVVKWHPSDPDAFWVGSDGGLWRTDDNANNFVNLNANLNITQFYDIAVNPIDPTAVYGGAQDNSSMATTGSDIWEVTAVTGDGFMNLVDPLDPRIVYQTSYAYSSGRGSLPRIYRSTRSGEPGSFSVISNGGIKAGPFAWVVPLAIAGNSSGQKSYMFTGSNIPYMLGSGDRRWKALASSGQTGNEALSVIEAVPHNGEMVVYVGNADSIYRTNNALSRSPSWANVTGVYPGGKVTDIAIDRSNPSRVFVTRGGFGEAQLYRTENAGGSWAPVGQGLPNIPANSVAIDPQNGQRIFVATDVGVFESLDGGNNFQAFMNGFPQGVPVQDLEIGDTPYVLSAATYGRGAWQTVLTPAKQ